MREVPPRIGAYFGFAAVTAWMALYLASALMTPGYGIMSHRLSDLGHPSHAASWAFNLACILAGFLFLPFAWALGAGMSPRMALPGRIMLSLAASFLVGVGAFPEESPVDLHFVFGSLFFLLFMMAISHYAVAMWRNPRYGKVSGTLGVLASGLALMFIVAALLELTGYASARQRGVSNLLEHATVFAGLAWAAWNGLRLHRMAPR